MADAVLFASSKIGVMAIEFIASLGLKIPDDVALVSFDNADAYKICISPVTVVGPLKEIGKTAVQVLMNEIAHSNDSLKFQRIDYLNIRSSKFAL